MMNASRLNAYTKAEEEARQQDEARIRHAQFESSRSRILDEHDEYQRALIRIDEKLEQLKTAWTTDVPLLIQQMRAAMPASIIATRKS